MRKFRKIMTAFLAAGAMLILTGCHHTQKQAQPVLTKQEVVQKSQKTFKSGQLIQSLRLSTDTANQLVVANTIFGGNPTVFHITNQTTSKGKTQNSEEWVNGNKVYLNGQKVWYHANLDQLAGHSYAELLNAVNNNSLLNNPSAQLVKAYHMRRSGQTYILTATLHDQKLMKAAVDPVVATIGQSGQQEQVFRRIQKYAKYQKMTVKLIYKQKKLYAFNVFTNMKLGKYMKVRIGQSYGNFGSHDFLTVPAEALNGKPLPMRRK